MNDLIPFDYHGKEVRTVTVNDEPWFVAKDVCEILDIQNVTQAVDRLDSDEVTMFNIGSQSGETNIVSESGLYSLTLGSKKPEAKPFKRWVTHEVIPAIRKTGSYTAKPMSQAEIIAAQANLLVEVERKSNAALETANKANNRLTTALDVFTKPTGDDWQQCMCARVRKICAENQLPHIKFFGELYREVDRTAHVDLKSRQSRKKTRLKSAGAKSVEIKAVSELSIIDGDPQLRLIFDGLVRKYEARYAAERMPKE